MKKLKIELENAIMERYKQSQIAEALEKEIRKLTKNTILEKYKGTKIKTGEFEYKLFSVVASLTSSELDFKFNKIEIVLIYTINSELNKDEKSELRKAKKTLDEYNFMGTIDNKKTKRNLYIEHSYKIDIENIIEGNINLEIKNRIY